MTFSKDNYSLNAYHLKMIALITMLLDHFARVIFPDLYFLKVIGRIAFILFSFLVVEGFLHTRSTAKYLLRLSIFAIMSEIPYDLAFSHTIYDPTKQNIFFTLSSGLISLLVLKSEKIASDIKVLLIVVLVTAANLFHFDYYYLGILQILFFYNYRRAKIKQFLMVGILNIFFMFRVSTQAAAILGLLPIYLYDGQLGKKTGILFYFIYPVHLVVFYLIHRYSVQ